MLLSRGAFLAAFLMTAGQADAFAPGEPTPGLVVDAGSGRVLFAEKATEPWFPASVTKLMTTYVALDAVRQGQLTMDTLLTMSAEAASQPPSKLGMKPGQTITLENALKVIMVKSANDVATLIGEGVGGSVEGFAARMNAASRRLGMRESRWVNPNGLPAEGQQTSARDMAILARALLSDFPEHGDLFRIGAVKLGNKVMRNHNGMLGRYPGVDGMKTGFICSAGFNIVASATQNGRRVIAVVMGYPSAKERDLRAADLFDHGFSSVGWGAQHVEELPPSGSLSPPDMRPIVCSRGRRVPQEDDESAIVQTTAAGGNDGNPITSLFSPSIFGMSGTSGTVFGRRRSLGPRVAFEPIPIWLGAAPGGLPEESVDRKGRPVRIAAKPVPTRVVGRAGAVGTVPGSKQSLTASVPPSSEGEGEKVETVKANTRPVGGATLRASLAPVPEADAKPKLGAIGAAATRPRHGAIATKPVTAVMEEDTSETKGSRGGASKAGSKKSTAQRGSDRREARADKRSTKGKTAAKRASATQ